MTDQDKRQQKAILLLEHQEAEEEVAHAVENVTRLGEKISEVAAWLTKSASPDFLRTSPEYSTLNAKLSNPSSSKLYADAMDFAKAKEAVEFLNDARKKEQELKKRKTELGLK